MSLIEANMLSKTFKVPVKQQGLLGAMKHLVQPEYQEKPAVNGIQLSIQEGEAVAYVGPNGAGKSTTIKMLTGILVPTSGTVTVGGLSPSKHRMENAQKIGVVFGQRTQLWWDLPIIESFALLKDIYEIPEPIYRYNMNRFVELLGLSEFLHLSARKISLGQRMRADLAAALLHNPKIVYLDEPTIGLDIAVKERIRRFIKEMNQQQGTTIMLTTHDLEDIEEICRRLIIIDKGRIIYDGELQAVKDRFAKERTMHFQVEQPITNLSGVVAGLPGVTLEKDSGLQFSLRFDRFAISAGEVAGHLMKAGNVSDFHIDEPKIDHVIRKVYEGELNLSKPEAKEA
ncbi:ABC transporter ATP-binding protein [Paenibacillus cremeus]|uniref:ATP-binding cassette domain-containing protein n=1 Tax=Paenibacillus cremeus TaxID=2163881 RepID=A0A559JKD7_9BACL|nr:ATP-binding cassette domain-containing protein [Paenibacillus cremeus]TVY00336.1 ATP-binding cassette domain-containing protein [Paenibacillus cremeus]